MLQTPDHTLASLMARDEQQFFKLLGARIAQLRKDAGLSQQAIADELEVWRDDLDGSARRSRWKSVNAASGSCRC